ncbi:MAG: RNA polymerase sigma factor, partial [Proteobacteria bacterium]|nr:RNA polymerase sigma factor [Pseudomonadota bacterium]
MHKDRFGALARPLLGDLYRFARRLERNDPVKAEDLLQQALLRGLTNMEQLRKENAFRVWMCRILFRIHLNNRQKPTEDFADPEVIPFPNGADPHQKLVAKRIGDTLLGALDELPEKQRDAVWLVDGQGFKYAEVADILDISPGTAASRVARGR